MNNASKKTILLVEDEALIAMAEKISLERYGYDVDTARTGEQAVEFFQTGRSVDLILMDIDLGAGIDGTQAAGTILQDHDIPVVFLSSHTEPEIVEKTEKITSYGYVVKSSSITILDASIKMAFRLFESKTKEEKKEQALRESEYRYRMLFENMNASFALHEMIYDDNGDPIDYRFLDVNPFFEQDTGIRAEAIIGRTAKELFPNTEQYWIDTFGKVAKTGESISYQNYSQEFDRHYDSYVFSPRRNQFAAFFVDITKFKQASEALEESEARFRVAQEVSPDGFTILHPVRNESNEIIDFAVRYQNSAIARVSGTDPQGVIGQHLLQLFPDHRDTPVFEAYLHVANTGETLVIEEMSVGEILSRPMSLRLVVVSMGTDIAILAQDITERKQVEAELLQINDELLKARERAQESEERTRYVLKHNPSAIAVFDNQMNFLIVSDRFLEDYNVEDRDIIGRNHYEIFPDIPKRWRKVHEEALQGEVLSNDDDYFVRLDGSITYSRWECRPWYHSDNRIGGMIAYTEVITKRKQAEVEIRKQLTEKETLLREVHHRVKNNIGSIEGLLALQAGSTDNPEAKVVLQDAISQIQATRILYEKLLIAEEYQRTAIQSYTESIVDSLRDVFDSEREIAIEKHIKNFELDAKRALSVGIIVNELLTNAFKYAFGHRDGGTVSVSIDMEEDRVTLVIQDDGRGFDERTMENQTPGFGFTIVRMLVEQLDGTFSIANENGAKVVVRFEV